MAELGYGVAILNIGIAMKFWFIRSGKDRKRKPAPVFISINQLC